MATAESRNFARAVNISLQQVLGDIALFVEVETGKKLQNWSRNASRNLKTKKGLKKMHQEVAQNSRRASLAAFELSGIGQRRSYRQADGGRYRRYSNGRMKKALEDSSIVVGNASGISFVNKKKMDSYAKQWYRLNFGTVGRGSDAPNYIPIEMFGFRSFRSASLKNYKPSKAPPAPPGYFSSTFAAATAGAKLKAPKGQGLDAFYPYRKNAGSRALPYKTVPLVGRNRGNKGIYGHRFLDAGANYINKNYGRKLETLVIDWLSQRK